MATLRAAALVWAFEAMPGHEALETPTFDECDGKDEAEERFMAPDTQTASGSKKMRWAGYIVSAILVLMLLMSGVMKLMKPPIVEEEFTRLGWPVSLALALGVVEIVCAVAYAIPGTSVLGAILLTGYLGGAIATHARLEEQFISPAVVGVLVWLGLFLRDERLRALIPLRRPPAR